MESHSLAGTEITEIGKYTFIITDDLGNKETVKFEIEKESELKSGLENIIDVIIPKLGEQIWLYVGIIAGLSVLIVVVIVLRKKK